MDQFCLGPGSKGKAEADEAHSERLPTDKADAFHARIDTDPMSRDEARRTQPRQAWGSLLLTGQARWRWQHGIPARRSDPAPGGGRLPRGRRVSLTFRTVVLPEGPLP